MIAGLLGAPLSGKMLLVIGTAALLLLGALATTTRMWIAAAEGQAVAEAQAEAAAGAAAAWGEKYHRAEVQRITLDRELATLLDRERANRQHTESLRGQLREAIANDPHSDLCGGTPAPAGAYRLLCSAAGGGAGCEDLLAPGGSGAP